MIGISVWEFFKTAVVRLSSLEGTNIPAGAKQLKLLCYSTDKSKGNILCKVQIRYMSMVKSWFHFFPGSHILHESDL